MQKRKINLPVALLSGAMFLSVAAMASAEATQDYTFDSVVVTATKTAKAIKDVPASVSVITAEDIARLNITNIDQALVMAAGVYDGRMRGIASTSTTVSMRGFSAASQTLVMVDGQPMNDAYSGVVSWSNIPIDSVERIEIVHGAASTLYGSQAMGGVINIITKAPKKASGQISTRWETNNTWVHTFNFSDVLDDKLSYRFDYEHKGTDGYKSSLVAVSPSKGTTGKSGVTGWQQSSSPTGNANYIIGDTGKTEWNENNYSLKLKYQMSEQQALSFGVIHNKYTYSWGEGHNYLSLNGSPFIGKASVSSSQYITASDKSFWGMPGGRETNVYTLNYQDKESGWTINSGFSDMVKNYNITSATDAGAGRIQEKPASRFSFDVQKEVKLSAKDQAVFGINYGKDKFTMTDTNLSNWRDASSKTSLYAQASGEAEKMALFLQNEHLLSPKLSVTTGLRYDRWSTKGTSQASATSENVHYDEKTFSSTSPKVAFQYKADDTSSLYLSWGKAFQAPDLYRIYSTALTGTYPNQKWTNANPDLKPQKVTTIELGGKKQLNDKTNIGVTYFHNNIKDMIYKRTLASSTLDGITSITRFENAGEGKTDGVELEINHRMNDAWSGFLNYTWQRPIITENVDSSLEGKLVNAVPKQILKFGLMYQKDKWSGSLIGNYASKRYSEDDNSDVVNNVYGSYDPYFVTNINASYQCDKNNTVTFGIDNLFDRDYYNYYLAPGRTYIVQMTHKF